MGATAKTVEAAMKAYGGWCGLSWCGGDLSYYDQGCDDSYEGSTLKDICEAVPIPAVAIGGIECWKYGCAGGRRHEWYGCGVCDHEGGGSAEECAGIEREDCCADGEIEIG